MNNQENLEFIIKMRDEATKVSADIVAAIDKQTKALDKQVKSTSDLNKEVEKSQRRRPSQYEIMPKIDPKQVDQIKQTTDAVSKLQDVVAPRNARSFMMSSSSITETINKAFGNDNSARGGFGSTMLQQKKAIEEVNTALSGSSGGGSGGSASGGLIGSFAGMAGAMAAGVVAGFSIMSVWQSMKTIFGDMVGATIAQEKAMKSLNDAMAISASTVGAPIEAVNSVISDFSQTFNKNRTEVTQAATALIQYGKVSERDLNAALKTTNQLAESMGTDLSGAARLYARALQDPQAALTILRRRGIEVDEYFKQHIEVLTATGRKTEAQTLLNNKLTESLGSIDSAQENSGLSGAMERAKTAWHELMLSFDDSAMEKVVRVTLDGAAASAKMAASLIDLGNAAHRIKVLQETGSWVYSGADAKKQADDLRRLHELRTLPFEIEAKRRQIAINEAMGPLLFEDQTDVAARTAKFTKEKEELEKRYAAAVKYTTDKINESLRAVEEVTDATVDFGTSGKAQIESVRMSAEDLTKELGRLMAVFNLVPGADGTIRAKALEIAKVNRESAEAVLKAKEAELAASDARNGAAVQRQVQEARAALELAKIREREADPVKRGEEELRIIKEVAAAGGAKARAEKQARITAEEAQRRQTPLDEQAIKRAGDLAAARQRVSDSMNGSDAIAAFNREIRNLLALSDAYDQGSRAANNLASRQKAAENAITGSGPTDASQIQFQAFLQTLVEAQKQMAETRGSFSLLLSSAQQAGDGSAAAIDKLLQGANKLRTDLMAKAPDGALGGRAAAEADAAFRKQAETDINSALIERVRLMNEGIAKNQDDVELLRVRAEYASASEKDMEIAVGLKRAELDHQRQINAALEAARRVGVTIDPAVIEAANAAYERQKDSIRGAAEAAEQYRNASGPVSQYLRSISDGWQQVQSSAVSAATAVEDSLSSVLMGTKDVATGFSEMARSIIADLQRIAIRKAITGPIMEGLFGGGDALGGFFGRAFGWLGSFFAGGGIMTANGPLPIHAYSGGGIARSPQISVFGEGSTPEAYVPVPNGRIPVELNGSGAGRNVVYQPTININMGNASGGGGQSDMAALKKQADSIAAMVKKSLNDHIQEQMRPGGLLNPAGNYNAQGVWS